MYKGIRSFSGFNLFNVDFHVVFVCKKTASEQLSHINVQPRTFCHAHAASRLNLCAVCFLRYLKI